MSVRSISTVGVVVLAAIPGLLGCGQDRNPGNLALVAPNLGDAQTAPTASLVTVPFNPANFVARVDNPCFPLVPGTVYSYVGQTAAGVQTVEVEVARDTKVILGVSTTVVHDRVFQAGSLLEDTFDWYAQDTEGNVWYFGEDTKEYENGVVVSTAGSFEAGKNGASAGIIMLARSRVGDSYAQESAPGVAEDMATVLSLDKTVSVPYGTFAHCLQTMEWTPLSPGDREFKYYAPGIGQVLTVSPRGGRERVELTAVSTR